jgi:hypothetical protein
MWLIGCLWQLYFGPMTTVEHQLFTNLSLDHDLEHFNGFPFGGQAVSFHTQTPSLCEDKSHRIWKANNGEGDIKFWYATDAVAAIMVFFAL